jgi:multiple sugar transport system ATP-binding protein
MTLGDRVAVLRKGVVQQVASPRELYQNPVNLFVAGFIGSPAMNFIPAEVEGGKVRLPMVEFDVPAEMRERVGNGKRQLIAGIRPEHFEDASLVGDDRRHGPTFRAKVDVIEWMGSELYAYIPMETSSGHSSQELAELAQDLENVGMGDDAQLVARLDAASKVREGGETELWLDARRVHLFDPQSGENLVHPPEAAKQPASS